MAAYATRTELAQLGINSAALTGIATADQDAALLAASLRADGYLKARFHLPLTAVGSDLKEVVCVIAAYNLLSTRGLNPESASGENLRLRYQDAIRWLEHVAGGKIFPTVTQSAPDGVDDDTTPLAGSPTTNSDGTGFTVRTGSNITPRGW